ncbi:MAG TPA: hypothetical protein VM536_12370, partial [Chloroflexia bacterium]|nr:hypothetical protein [Chloroflexia bacterium]
GCYERLTRPGPWLLLTGVVTLAALSHPGNVQLIALLLGGMWVAWGIQAWRGRNASGSGAIRSWWAFTAVLVTAAAIAWFSYYTHFAASQLETLREIQAERAATQATSGFSIKTGGEVNDPSLGLLQRIVHDRAIWLASGLTTVGAEAWAFFHAWPLLWAALGLFAARRAPDPARRRMLLTAGVWVAVVALYAVVGWAANLYVRYPLFVLPLVALGGGLLLSGLARRGRLGGWLVLLVLLVSTVDALSFWYMRILFANK